MDPLLATAARLLASFRDREGYAPGLHTPDCNNRPYWDEPDLWTGCSWRCLEVARVLLAVDQRAAAEARAATAQGALWSREEAG